MDTNPLTSREQDLIEQLQNLPLKKVPADLTDRVMARISSPKPTLISAIWNFVSQSQTISFRPIYAIGVALLICGSFFLGQISHQNPVQVATTIDSEPQIQPETLENAESAYMVGRGLLQADNNEAQALAFLRRASLLEPQNPEFAYWEGVGHWANGDKEGERRSYLRGLGTDPQSVPLLINLGHNYLSDKKYNEALDAYQAALALSPNEPVALYNSGLIYRALNRVPEEISSWRSFLQDNRLGAHAFRAVTRLNGYNDYSFRTYRVGPQKIIINQQALLDESLSEDIRQEELAPLASILEQDERLTLEVVAFIENDREAARQRAFEIKKMILKMSDSDIKKQVRLSWFDAPETLQGQDGASAVELSEGLLLFSRLRPEQEKEVAI
ncbi:MAG: tetratricopeptide repeat protein [Desulfocapsaceae bacterium]